MPRATPPPWPRRRPKGDLARALYRAKPGRSKRRAIKAIVAELAAGMTYWTRFDQALRESRGREPQG
jgi:hypothetical protein